MERGKYVKAWLKNNWVLLIFSIFVFALFFFNLLTNKDFWISSASSIFSIFAVLFLSYYLTQKRNDQRKKLENYDRLICKIQDELYNEAMFCANSKEEQNKALNLQRSLGNKLKYFMDFCDEELKDDAKYMSDEYVRLKTLYGNHMSDVDYINKSKEDFKNGLCKIDDRCEELHLKIFK